MWTKETPSKNVIRRLDKIKACRNAKSWYDKYKDKPSEELVKGSRDKEFHQGWSVWCLQLFGKDTETDLRIILIEAISDPMMAFQCYIKLPFLTDKEYELLLNKFKGKLPRAEQELKENIVVMVRDV